MTTDTQVTSTWSIVKRDGKTVAVVKGDAMPWFHRHVASCSMSHALEHEGYTVETPERWDADKAQQERLNAWHYMYGDQWHNSGGCRREGRLGRENCAQCCLGGYEPRGGFGDDFSVRRDGPNVGGWTRTYVASGRAIPVEWKAAFMAALDSDNRGYADALARDIATFGIRWVR